MKNLVFAFFASLLLFGCGSPDLDNAKTLKSLDEIIAEAIDGDKLEKRGKEGEELIYASNVQMPYTGWVKYENGQVWSLAHFKDGKRNGLTMGWYKNGQKKEEENYKDGKRDGLKTAWYITGQKWEEGNFKDGKRDGLKAAWYKNGQKKEEGNSKDGLLVTVIVWKPNGEKCPITNVVDGNGVYVRYREDGTQSSRWSFKDGELVETVSYRKDGTVNSRFTFKDGKFVAD